ncbi:MAG: carboxypeptidase-like regulatory domain-containing protein, partial [Bacteroidetes bacterium]|nr:carboxypeptidase-like regulatory domain-containing protein [Bacteroidota bacterium]
MEKRISYILICFFGVFLPNLLSAQSGNLEITGKVVEGDNQNPIEFATVLLLDKETQKPLAGSSTDQSGVFTLKFDKEDIVLEISFIGFEKYKNSSLELKEGKTDLGVISLSESVKTLDEVQIRAEKSQTEFKLDKRVFNVGTDLSSTGASALEVLNNVPSVNVNIEGQISLRGSQGVQVLINGKPSVIASEQGNALGTITADMIDKIEVITNPSAKYEAEGTSGIINIVLKKEERKGINGSVTLNTGAPHNHSLGLSLNRRTEKFNLFSQLGVGYRNMPSVGESINEDLVNQTSILSTSDEEKYETFYNFILGADYHINQYNVMTLSGSYALEQENQPS